jgi:uncharacterized membrane protein YccC
VTRWITAGRGGAPAERDPEHVALRRAARVVVVGTPLFVILGWVLDLPEAAIPAVFAVLSLGARADFGGPLPRRVLRYAYAGLASLAVLPLGAALAGNDVALVVVTGTVVFATMFLGTLGGPFFAARFPVVLSLLFATTAGQWGSTLPDRMLGWAVGCVAITIAAIVLWPLRPRTPATTLVAELCREVASDAPSDQLLATVHRLRTTATGAHLLVGAVATDERIAAELAHASERLAASCVMRGPGQPAPEDAALHVAMAQTLAACADALCGTTPSAALAPPLEQAIAAHVDAGRARVEARAADAVAFAARALPMRETARHACTIAHLVDELGGRASAADAAALLLHDYPLASLRAQWNPRSLWFRNAVRASIALMAAVAVVLAGAGEGHGFWVALGAFSVLRADLATTRQTARAVIIGTAIGFVVSSIAIVITEPSEWLLWGLFPIALALAASGDRFSPEASAAGFSTLFVSLYSLVDPVGLQVGEVRMVDVALGAGITLVIGAILWPRVGTVPRGMLADVVERARRELRHAVARASGRDMRGGADPRGPLAVLADLDRILDTIASDAPRVIRDEERAAIVKTVSVAVNDALLVSGPATPRWIGFGAEDRIAWTVEPALAGALTVDGARVDGALGARIRRLAGSRRDDTASPLPGALIAIASDRLTDPSVDTAATFGAIRVGAGLERLAWLADRDVGDAARQAPTVTGTLE